MVLGNGLDPGVDMGPVVSAAARDRLFGAITRASRKVPSRCSTAAARRCRAAEGLLRRPDRPGPGAPGMRAYKEELFGPVVGMTPVGSLDEAIAQINAAEYGNAASIFTESGRLPAVPLRGRTGNIGINVGVAAPVAMFPFSGAKQSFLGMLHPQGRDAIRFFTESKVVITRWTTGDGGTVTRGRPIVREHLIAEGALSFLGLGVQPRDAIARLAPARR